MKVTDADSERPRNRQDIDPIIKQKSSFVDPDISSLRICAVCISRNQETWEIQGVPFYNYTEGWKPFLHEKTTERIAYLAERRNKAVAEALELFPETQHVLMIDSYYLHQEEQVMELMQEYATLIHDGCILGASTWILDKTRIRPRIRFYDNWTTPEATELKLKEAERQGGTISVKGVGGCYLYPRGVWEKTGYDVLEDLHGCEHNWLCERSGLRVLLSLEDRLWREPIIYPMLKRIRMSAHLGRVINRKSRGVLKEMILIGI